MARISEQSIEQVRNAADVVDVISDYVDLKQKGRNFFGLCPFHSEKTPSFSVNPEKQLKNRAPLTRNGNPVSAQLGGQKISLANNYFLICPSAKTYFWVPLVGLLESYKKV